MVVDWVLQSHASSGSGSSKVGNRDEEQNVSLFICLVVLFLFCLFVYPAISSNAKRCHLAS